MQSLLWPLSTFVSLKHPAHTVTAVCITYYVASNWSFPCLASLDFQLLDGQGFAFSVLFHCLGQCLVSSKTICVWGSSAGLLIHLTLFVQNNSERGYIKYLAQVKTPWPIGVTALQQWFVGLFFSPFSKAQADLGVLASKLSEHAAHLLLNWLLQIPLWLHPKPYYNCFFSKC